MTATPPVEAQSGDTSAPRPRLSGAFNAQLASTGIANLADGILSTVAPLVALGLTASPVQISMITAAGWLPWLLLGLFAGVVVDRRDRKSIQVVALVVRALVLAVAAAAAATGSLTMGLLLVVVLIYGITEVFADLAATAIVPQLVPADRLEAANGRIVGVQQVANSFLGAPVGGALLIAGSAAGFGAAGGLAALAGVVLLRGMRGSYRPRPTDVRGGGPMGPWGQVRDGVRFLFRHPVLRPLVITGSVLNFAMTGYFAVFVLWAVGPSSAIGLTSSQYPLLMLGFALGAVGGSLVVEAVRRRLGELPTIVITLVLSLLLMVVPVWWPNGWIVAADLALIGALNTIGNVASRSMSQRLVPEGLQGRVNGASKTLGFGLMPLGAVCAGVVAEGFGLATTFIAAVVVSLLACGYLVLALARRTSTTPNHQAG